MTWKKADDDRSECWNIGTPRQGGTCWPRLGIEGHDGWIWRAWTADAISDRGQPVKTLKAAQRAGERGLEKHG